MTRFLRVLTGKTEDLQLATARARQHLAWHWIIMPGTAGATRRRYAAYTRKYGPHPPHHPGSDS